MFPPNLPFLITSTGVIFGLKSIYNAPLSSKLDVFKIIIAFFINITNINPIIITFNS